MLYIDKIPWKSKKFLAFAGVEIILTALLIILFVTQSVTWPVALLGSVLALGQCALAIGYILGQAALDKFVDGVGKLAGAIPGINKEEDEEYDG